MQFKNGKYDVAPAYILILRSSILWSTHIKKV